MPDRDDSRDFGRPTGTAIMLKQGQMWMISPVGFNREEIARASNTAQGLRERFEAWMLCERGAVLIERRSG